MFSPRTEKKKEKEEKERKKKNPKKPCSLKHVFVLIRYVE